MNPSLTPLHPWHVAHQGRMVDFAGWSMPVHYTSIVDEHLATRRSVALFDISHMGRLTFSGAEAEAFLSHIVTRRVDNLRSGQIRYGLITNPSGGILDDILVYRLPAGRASESASEMIFEPAMQWMLVVNAGNRAKIIAWIEEQRSRFDCHYEDLTERSAMIAVQGPRAVELMTGLLQVPDAATALSSTGYYSGRFATWEGHEIYFSRTGYTGEDGCELIVPAAHAVNLWERIGDAASSSGVELKPAGLGARDTLRLEAAMPLYGHELSEQINPYEAGLGFAVHLKKDEFIGKSALTELREQVTRRRIGINVDSKRIARQHCPVWFEGREVGEVTSGTFSPTLEQPIAMAMVETAATAAGTPLEIDIRGSRVPAKVVDLPFYSRT